MKKFFIRLVFRPVVHPLGVEPRIPGYKPGAKNRLTLGAFVRRNLFQPYNNIISDFWNFVKFWRKNFLVKEDIDTFLLPLQILFLKQNKHMPA